MSKTKEYVFELTIHEGNDEWWELVNTLPNIKARREEIQAEITRTLAERGFFVGDNAFITPLRRKK